MDFLRSSMIFFDFLWISFDFQQFSVDFERRGWWQQAARNTLGMFQEYPGSGSSGLGFGQLLSPILGLRSGRNYAGPLGIRHEA